MMRMSKEFLGELSL